MYNRLFILITVNSFTIHCYRYRTKLSTNTSEVVEPEDEAFEIHNERLWIKKSGPASVADYQCKALKSDSNTPIDKEEATFQVRGKHTIVPALHSTSNKNLPNITSFY